MIDFNCLLIEARTIYRVANTENWYFSEISKLVENRVIAPEEIDECLDILSSLTSSDDKQADIVNFFYLLVFALANYDINEAKKFVDANQEPKIRWIKSIGRFLDRPNPEFNSFSIFQSQILPPTIGASFADNSSNSEINKFEHKEYKE